MKAGKKYLQVYNKNKTIIYSEAKIVIEIDMNSKLNK